MAPPCLISMPLLMIVCRSDSPRIGCVRANETASRDATHTDPEEERTAI